MSFTCTCPHCQTTLDAPDHYLGREVKCHSCQKCFIPVHDAERQPGRERDVMNDVPHPPGQTWKSSAGRVPCPKCSEAVLPTATLCPYCKQPIFSRDKGADAIIGIIVTLGLFFIIFYALNTCVEHEAKYEFKELMKEIDK